MYMLQQVEGNNMHSKRSSDAQPSHTSKRLRADDSSGAQQSDDAQPQGQFAHLVRSETHPAQSAASPGSAVPSNKDREPDSVRTKPDFQKFVSNHLKRPPVVSGGLYDMLPPEKSRQVH